MSRPSASNFIGRILLAMVAVLIAPGSSNAADHSSPAATFFHPLAPDWLFSDLTPCPEPCSPDTDSSGCASIDVGETDNPDVLLPWLPHQTESITFEALYTGEVLSNTRGGLNTNGATRYRGVADVAITADLDQLFGLSGTSIFINAGQMHGKSLSVGDVGDWQFVSNIDSSPFTQLTQLTQLNEYWIRQELGDAIWFKVGRIDANADFGFADLAGDFANSSFGQMPTIPLPVWPAQSLGVTGFVSLTDDLLFAAGTYNGNTMATNWGIPVPDQLGYVTLGHLELKTTAGAAELPGTWRLGSWFQSGDWQQITTAPVGKTFGHNFGLWCTADQMLIEEDSSGEIGQGLGAFFEYGWSPEDRNFVGQSYGTGFVYRGLLDNRDEDVVGIGWTQVRFGNPTRLVNGVTSEDTWELFYKYQARSWFSLQPDMQYIANPSGNGRDSLVAGLRFEVAL